MNGKERVIAALEGRPTDTLPACPAYVAIPLESIVRDLYVDQYRYRVRGIERHPVVHEEDVEIRSRALAGAYGYLHNMPDWIDVIFGVHRAWAGHTHIVTRDGELYYEDQRTGKQAPMATTRMPQHRGGGEETQAEDGDRWEAAQPIRSEEDARRRVPIVRAEEQIGSGSLDLTRMMVSRMGETHFVYSYGHTPYAAAYLDLGFETMLTMQVENPKLLHRIIQHLLEREKERLKAQAMCGLHGVYGQEAFSGADMISPRAYDEFVHTYNVPYFQFMRSLGLKAIYLITGNCVPRVRRATELDIDGLATEHGMKEIPNEFGDIVEQAGGKVPLFGNVDVVRFGENGTPADVAQEVKRQAALGARARAFLVSTGAPYPDVTNFRNIDALIDTARALPGRPAQQ